MKIGTAIVFGVQNFMKAVELAGQMETLEYCEIYDYEGMYRLDSQSDVLVFKVEAESG